MKTNKYFYALALVASLSFTGCGDFLDTENNSSITGENFYPQIRNRPHKMTQRSKR